MTHVPVSFHVAAAILATGRMVALVASDKITEGLRRKTAGVYLVSCQYCLSVWAGAAATVMFVFTPWVNWVFALSWLWIAWLSIKAKREETKREKDGKVLKIVLKDGKATWTNDLTDQELTATFIALGLAKPAP